MTDWYLSGEPMYLAPGETRETLWQMFLLFLPAFVERPFRELEVFRPRWRGAGEEPTTEQDNQLRKWADRWDLEYDEVLTMAHDALRHSWDDHYQDLQPDFIDVLNDWVPGPERGKEIACDLPWPPLTLRVNPAWPLASPPSKPSELVELDPDISPHEILRRYLVDRTPWTRGWDVMIAGRDARGRAHEVLDVYLDAVEDLARQYEMERFPDLRKHAGVVPEDRFRWLALRLCGDGPGRRMSWARIAAAESNRLGFRITERALRKAVKKLADAMGVEL